MKKKIGGLELAWEEAGAGPPLVLLHAFPLHRGMWAAQRREFSKRHRVLTPDFRGFGESQGAEEDSAMDLLADDLRGLLDALQLDRVVLGGLSMGGYVSFAFYRRYPERVAALILADTRATPDSPEARKQRHELAAAAEREGSDVVAERMVTRLLAPSTPDRRPDIVRQVREMILSNPPAALARALRGMAARPDSTPLLKTIKCPTLVLVGEEDILTPPSDSEALAKGIQYARLERIRGAGHLSNLEQPGPFNRAVSDFLASLPGKS
ncbi:MAG: alpha/beta fold hydrolase [Candidatus Acidiferrales bacterium]